MLVVQILEMFLEVIKATTTPSKLSILTKTQLLCDAFSDTSICYHLSQMVRETQPSDQNSEMCRIQIGNDHYYEELDEIIVQKGFVLMKNLCTVGVTIMSATPMAQKFANNGTIHIVSKRMKQFYNNEAMQEEACKVLCAVSNSFVIAVAAAAADLDTTRTKTRYLDTTKTKTPCQYEAFETTTMTTTTFVSKVFNDSVLKILCSTMKQYPKNCNLQCAAMSTLRNIKIANRNGRRRSTVPVVASVARTTKITTR